MTVSLFGVRHHGPGCARALRAELERLQPDAVLIEGPPDADGLIPMVGVGGLRPPVALLVYARDAPSRAAFYPFAEWSPEWQAMQWAVVARVPVRFMDLPLRHQLTEGDQRDAPAGRDPAGASLDALGVAAGARSWDGWWEREIEQRRETRGLFEAVAALMRELRGQAGLEPRSAREAQREAWMRRTIRRARSDGHQRIAVVCGAWHVPALESLAGVARDDKRLRGLRRVPGGVEATWIPWTHGRMAAMSPDGAGYGAGVAYPGWHEHLWRTATGSATAARWATSAARLLRARGLDAPPASVIEVVRLADALAAIRGRSTPGVAELHEAIRAVLCHGDAAPMSWVREGLEVGDALGAVPAGAPMVPLQRDVESLQRSARLKPQPGLVDLDLDLRKPRGLARSHLLHRLRAIDVPWGQPEAGHGRARGTFHELWTLSWRPELWLRVVEANAAFGNTLEVAAIAALRQRGRASGRLSQITDLLAAAIVADLPEAVDDLLTALSARAAAACEVRELMDSVPPLARVARYGDVRGTTFERLEPVIAGLVERALIGLPGGSRAIDDDAAAATIASLDAFARAIWLLDHEDQHAELAAVLDRLAEDEGAHQLVSGFAARLLVERRSLPPERLEGRAGRALSAANPPERAAAWLEGLLRGSALVLLHHQQLWRILDGWLSELTADRFRSLLPVLRRAFSGFEPAARRRMGESLQRLHQGSDLGPADGPAPLDEARAALVLPVLGQLLGRPLERSS